MQLSIEIVPGAGNSASLRLADRAALGAGDVYDPLFVAFPEPPANWAALSLSLLGPGDALLAHVPPGSFSPVPSHPRVLRSSVPFSLSSSAFTSWYSSRVSGQSVYGGSDSEGGLPVYVAEASLVLDGGDVQSAPVPVLLRPLGAFALGDALETAFTEAARAAARDAASAEVASYMAAHAAEMKGDPGGPGAPGAPGTRVTVSAAFSEAVDESDGQTRPYVSGLTVEASDADPVTVKVPRVVAVALSGPRGPGLELRVVDPDDPSLIWSRAPVRFDETGLSVDWSRIVNVPSALSDLQGLGSLVSSLQGLSGAVQALEARAAALEGAVDSDGDALYARLVSGTLYPADIAGARAVSFRETFRHFPGNALNPSEAASADVVYVDRSDGVLYRWRGSAGGWSPLTFALGGSDGEAFPGGRGAALEAGLASLGGRVGALEGALSGAEEGLAALGGAPARISALEAEASDSSTGFAALGSRVSALEGAVQADWSESDPASRAFVRNRPPIPSRTSQLANDAGFLVPADVAGKAERSELDALRAAVASAAGGSSWALREIDASLDRAVFLSDSAVNVVRAGYGREPAAWDRVGVAPAPAQGQSYGDFSLAEVPLASGGSLFVLTYSDDRLERPVRTYARYEEAPGGFGDRTVYDFACVVPAVLGSVERDVAVSVRFTRRSPLRETADSLPLVAPAAVDGVARRFAVRVALGPGAPAPALEGFAEWLTPPPSLDDGSAWIAEEVGRGAWAARPVLVRAGTAYADPYPAAAPGGGSSPLVVPPLIGYAPDLARGVFEDEMSESDWLEFLGYYAESDPDAARMLSAPGGAPLAESLADWMSRIQGCGAFADSLYVHPVPLVYLVLRGAAGSRVWWSGAGLGAARAVAFDVADGSLWLSPDGSAAAPPAEGDMRADGWTRLDASAMSTPRWYGLDQARGAFSPPHYAGVPVELHGAGPFVASVFRDVSFADALAGRWLSPCDGYGAVYAQLSGSDGDAPGGPSWELPLDGASSLFLGYPEGMPCAAFPRQYLYGIPVPYSDVRPPQPDWDESDSGAFSFIRNRPDVLAAVSTVVAGAPEALDTLREIADLLAGSDSDAPGAVLSRLSALEARIGSDSDDFATRGEVAAKCSLADVTALGPTPGPWALTPTGFENVISDTSEATDTGKHYWMFGEPAYVSAAGAWDLRVTELYWAGDDWGGGDNYLEATGGPSATSLTFTGENFPGKSVAATAAPGKNANGLARLVDLPTKTSDLTNDSGFLTSHQDISGKENASNKVTALSLQSTDMQYPSAKCVYDQLQLCAKPYPFVTPTFAQTGDWTFSGMAAPSGYHWGMLYVDMEGDEGWRLLSVPDEGSDEPTVEDTSAVPQSSATVSFTTAGVTATRGYVATLTPFTNAQIDMTSQTMSGITAFEIAVGASPVQGAMRDLILVIDCTATGAVAPTVTWGTHFHPRTDTATDLAIVEAGKRAVFYISEYAPGEFAVGGWQETAGGSGT